MLVLATLSPPLVLLLSSLSPSASSYPRNHPRLGQFRHRNQLLDNYEFTPAYMMSFSSYPSRYRPEAAVTLPSVSSIIRNKPSSAFLVSNITTSASSADVSHISSIGSSSNCNTRLNDIEGLSSDEAQAIGHLERAHSALITFHQKIRTEMEQMREKDRLLSEELAKLTHEVNHNDQQLSVCQTSLHALEATINDVYIREKDMSKSASSLEDENSLLRERLRKLVKVDIKRADHKNNASVTRCKAIVVHNNISVAAFSSVRYMMDEGFNLVIEDLVKKLSVPIVKGFNYLKILKQGNEYRIALANQRGNQFFEHKKYDKFYAVIPNSMKTLPSSAILFDKPINWAEMNSKCGFWSCFSLKPGPTEYTPEVINTRDKTRVGVLFPFAAYFDFNDLTIVSSGKEETIFSNPYLDRDRVGQFSIREDVMGSHKKFAVDLNLLEITDRMKFNLMIQTAFP